MVVWPLLYTLMGLALWRLRLLKKRVKLIGLGLFSIQLTLNALWPFVFFTLKKPLAALSVILLLWLSITICLSYYVKKAPLAFWLLLPYWFWVSFAIYLNFFIWAYN
jgi:tryptophan-rich sensory protein